MALDPALSGNPLADAGAPPIGKGADKGDRADEKAGALALVVAAGSENEREGAETGPAVSSGPHGYRADILNPVDVNAGHHAPPAHAVYDGGLGADATPDGSGSLMGSMSPSLDLSGGPRLSRKRKAQSEDSEQELRRHAEAFVGLSLNEMAEKVRLEDSNLSAGIPSDLMGADALGGPASAAASSERAKQIFGIVWLRKACEVSPDNAIPRNRIYARYVGVCAHHRIKPLNPAAIGKLVRLVYPTIKTRRLGVRGQSKYHYCGINIIGDAVMSSRGLPELLDGSQHAHMYALNDHGGLGSEDSHGTTHSTAEPESIDDRSDYRDLDLLRDQKPPVALEPSPLPARDVRVAEHTEAEELAIESDARAYIDSLSDLYVPKLQFGQSSSPLDMAPSFDNIDLPDITPYVPAGTDSDSVEILTGVCKTHCATLLGAVRYMQLKQFLNTLTTFHGALTAPTKRLLKIPSILQWIQQCDWIMYKMMIRMVSPLALQVVPSNVLAALRSLSLTLPQSIATAFKPLPDEFVRVKIKPATAFSNLLGRLLRVNETANAAAKILAQPADRDLMCSDWVRYVDSKSIVLREAPCGSLRVLQILEQDVVKLLTTTIAPAVSPRGRGVPRTPRKDDKSAETDSAKTTPRSAAKPKRAANAGRETPHKRADRTSAATPTDTPTSPAGADESQATETDRSEIGLPTTPTPVTARTTESATPSHAPSPIVGLHAAYVGDDAEAGPTAEGIIDRWAEYLVALPSYFPHLSARMFLLYMNGVLTAALREITLNGGSAFGAWWMVRCWIDEWMAWIAEQGGFLETDFAAPVPGRDVEMADAN
ncbi:uncharacterized protein V1510DRAFT_423958 [Dipodascopsis tothii]|uniref:uncharacterized protein n=1 Tax=Dipodascopsis tothii TaxID=44089 RepID=UPI0034CD5786